MRTTNTPTPSHTPTPSITPSNTPSLTPTGTACPGSSPTTTPSNTPSPTLTSTPTGTNQPTPSITSSPTPTPTCSYKEWFVGVCTSSCSGGTCACVGAYGLTLYTDCGVTDLTDPSTIIYLNQQLETNFFGIFQISGSIYYSDGPNGVDYICTIGGSC